MRLTRLTPLDGEAILSLADAKDQVKVRHTDEDVLIASLRDAAILHIERITGVALAPAEYRWTMRCFETRIDLPMRPVTEISEITYHDEDGEDATYTGWRLIEGSVLSAITDAWPYAHGYAAVTFTAGLESPDEAPDLLAAIRLMLGHLYANREAVNVGNITSELPLGVASLVQSYQMVRV